ncbi:MAG: EI24 domain-containing protein [Myxococcales bacterium]|nr:EI24 domain-containing protein [Myxococcales bacterium]
MTALQGTPTHTYPLAPGRSIGLGAGLRACFGGIGFVVTTPSAWGWAMVPMLVAFTILGGLSGLGIWGAVEIVSKAESWKGTAGGIALGVLAPFVAFLIAAALAQPLSGFALDAIVQKQERALGLPARPNAPFFSSLFRSLRVTLLGLAVGLPILGLLALITALFAPAAVVTVPLKFFVTSLLVAWDFLDYPLSQRQLGVRQRLSWIFSHFVAVCAFGAMSAAILLIPGIGLVMLPFGVAGATRLVLASERG